MGKRNSGLPQLFAGAASGAILALTPGLAHAQSSDAATLDEVVVTAQKREENLQTVPVAVTAVSSQVLQTIRYQDVTDLSAISPGVSVIDTPGGALLANLTMRGLYSASTVANNSGSPLYIDGVYVGNALGSEFDLATIERVEVLRGPQGTLFGLNALSGAVNLITKEPSGRFGVRQEFSAGNRSQLRSKTSIDFPAWGMLSASATYLHDEVDGDVKNLGAGTVWRYGPGTGGKYGDLVSPKRLGGHNTDAVSATLKLEPGSDIEVVYRFNYSHKTFTPSAATPMSFTTGNGLGAFVLPFYNSQNASIRSPLTDRRPDATNNFYTVPGRVKLQTHSLIMTVPINDIITVKDIVGYRKTDLYSTADVTGFGGILVSPGNPLIGIGGNNESHQKAFSNEFQINVDTERFRSTFGYLHYYNRLDEGAWDNIAQGAFGVPLFPFPPPYLNFVVPNIGTKRSLFITKSDGLFTQNEIHLTSKLDIVGGLRWTKDRRSGLDNSPLPLGPGLPVKFRGTKWTWLAGVNYKVNDDIFTYAKYSTGYLQGGQLAGLSFGASTAKSLEGGVKADLLNRTLRANLAVYSVKYGNLQVQSSPQTGCRNLPGVSLFAVQCIINGGDVRANGAELELTYLPPVKGLTLNSNVAYNDAHYTKIIPSVRAPDGSFLLTYTPKWTASATVSYVGEALDSFGGGHLIGQATLTYESRKNTSPTSGIAVGKSIGIPSTVLVNARLGLAGISIAGAEVEVAAYAKNLFNNKNPEFICDCSLDVNAKFQTARTFGVDVITEF